MSLLVGLTGGIACGKSTVGRLLGERGARIVDADRVARQVVEPGTPTLGTIVQAFGPEVLDGDGHLDRSALGRLVFEDPQARQTLESITHPAIQAAIAVQVREHLEAGADAVVVEAALLVETGSHRLYDHLFVVSCERATQLRRLRERDGWTTQEAMARIDSQLPLSEKEQVADTVIRNNGSLKELEAQVEEAWVDLGSKLRER